MALTALLAMFEATDDIPDGVLADLRVLASGEPKSAPDDKDRKAADVSALPKFGGHRWAGRRRD
jgi:hypothetical protein